MSTARPVRSDVVDTCRLLCERGWVANHDGNITVRLSTDRYLATPTATAKGAVGLDSLVEVDSAGKRVVGTARPFGELGLHLAVYQRRDDVRAVVHAHPPHATAIACSRENPIEQPFIAEAVVSIGPWIPRVPFTLPGPDATAAVAAVAGDVDAVLLDNHGVMAWGATVEQAFLRLELVEHLARIALLAMPLGGPVPLPEWALAPLLAARARAGLGCAADKAPSLATPRAPALAGPAATTAAGGDIAAIVRDELERALRRS